METNKDLAFFLQILTENIVSLLCKEEYVQFVFKTLEMTNNFLLGKHTDPGTLYDRLENLDEQDILTYFDLDSVSNPAVWSCIANAVAYICLVCYVENGEKYLPETIEAVDIETLNSFFENYKVLIKDFENILFLREKIIADERVNLDNPEVKKYYQILFS